MNDPWQRYYQLPSSPLARLGLALLGLAILAISLMLGLVFLAVSAGLFIIGAIVISVRRWLGLGRRPDAEKGPLDVEYRVIRRERSSSRRDP